MARPAGRRQRPRFKFLLASLLVVFVFGFTTTSTSNDNDDEPEIDPSIADAIQKCRSKIAESDSDHPSVYPRTRLRLAALLEYTYAHTGTNHDQEILYLYETAATNQTLAAEEQFDAWTRAAVVAPSPEAKKEYLKQALSIDDDGDIPESRYGVVFEDYMHVLLQQCTEHLHRDTDERHALLLREGLLLCDFAEQHKCPNEPVVDEYRGVLLRKQYKQQQLEGRTVAVSVSTDGAPQQEVYKAYASAATKARAMVGNAHDDASVLCTQLLRYIILAASAAREAQLFLEENHQIAAGRGLLEESSVCKKANIDPSMEVEYWNTVGISFKARGDSETAGGMFRKALGVDPHDGHALVQLASLGDQTAAASTCLSSDYVSGLFDGYSDRFEEELVDRLDYKGHTMVATALQKYLLNFSENDPWTMVDLGCGTGLLGSLFREMAPPDSVLWGVDLSGRMVKQAQGRRRNNNNNNNSNPSDDETQRVYNQVSEMDVTAFVRELETNTVDIIGASDVFIYVGDLEELFRECHRALLSNGLLSFTVESPSSKAANRLVKKNGVGLLESGRFGHSRAYIKGLAKTQGYAMREWNEGVLRKQGHEDVKGAVVVLQKTDRT